MVTNIFVYGTLRSGFDHPMADKLSSIAKYEGKAILNGAHMYLVSWYPAVILDQFASSKVIGDVFSLPNDHPFLLELDEYEGIENLPNDEYVLQSVEVLLEKSNLEISANCYIWNRSVDGLKLLRSGDWIFEAEEINRIQSLIQNKQ